MAELPCGTVTFLFTDIEGSTHLWQEHSGAVRSALARHDGLAAAVIAENSGVLVRARGEGDSLFCVFSRATDALAGAAALQRAFVAEAWPAEAPLRVRMALHTGEADLRDGSYYGTVVNRCARLRSLASGGQTLLSQTVYDLVRDHLPDSVGLRDLGAHRLRDLYRPEHVFQLLHPDLPTAFPPLRSLDVLPNNLPVQITSFVGRGGESAQVKALLGTTRLLSVTGPGGAGKTRLALQVAADMLEGDGDGVWLAELAPLSDPALVPQEVASALGVREEPGRELTLTLRDFLRPKRLLLVLDNCEHLLGACAALADLLLRTCPGVTLLATSRSPLGIAGETTFPVPSLSLPDLKNLPPAEGLSQYEAVALFIQRAQAAQPSFAVTNANAPAVAQICHRLDGIPLALELAAARVRSLHVEQLAARLDDRFRLLTGGSRAALPRQQTLRALVDWSYALLSDREKTLLRRLAVFAGGWTLDAAEAVCAGNGVAPEDIEHGEIEGGEVLDGLTSLVDKSLVGYDDADGQPRYRLLETIRQYAQERLAASEDEAATRERHATFFLRLVEDLERAARAEGGEREDWYECMEVEQENVRVALAWCRSAPGAAETGMALAGASFWYWYYSGRFSEGRACLEAELGVPVDTTPCARAKALAGAGCMALMLNDYNGARVRLGESVTLCREAEDNHSLGLALFLLGMLHTYAGDLATGKRLSEEARALSRTHGSQVILGYCLVMLGLHAAMEGDEALAETLFLESITLGRALRNKPHIGIALVRLGDLRQNQGRHEEAWSAYAECLTYSRGGESVLTLARCLHGLAGLWAVRGDWPRTVRLLSATGALFARMGASMPSFEAAVYERNIAAARVAVAEDVFRNAWSMGQSMPHDIAVADVLAQCEDGADKKLLGHRNTPEDDTGLPSR